MRVLIIQCKDNVYEEEVRKHIKEQIKDGGIIVLSPRVTYEIADIGEKEWRKHNGST